MQINERIETVYQHLQANGANCLITEDLRLVEKKNCFVRLIHCIAANIGLFDPKKEPTYIPTVVSTLSCYLSDSPELTQETRAHAEFIKQTLIHIHAKKNPHHSVVIADNAPIARLPTELRKEIFKYLTPPELANARAICKQWKRECEDQGVWQAVLKQPANRRLKAAFAPSSRFPQTLEGYYRALQQATPEFWSTGEFVALDGDIQFLGGTPEAFCLVHDGHVFIKTGDRLILMPGHPLCFQYANDTLYKVTHEGITRWDLVTLEEETFTFDLPDIVNGFGVEDGFVDFVAKKRPYRFNLQDKTLTQVEIELDFLDTVLFEHFCFANEMTNELIRFIDLTAPHKGIQSLPDSGLGRVGAVSNGIAYVHTPGYISLYDLQTKQLLDRYEIYTSVVSTLSVDEGLLIVQGQTILQPAFQVQVIDLVTRRQQPKRLFALDDIVPLYVKKRNVRRLTQAGELVEANLLFAKRDRFEIRSFFPAWDTVEKVLDATATFFCTIACMGLSSVAILGSIYQAAILEYQGKGNWLTRLIIR